MMGRRKLAPREKAKRVVEGRWQAAGKCVRLRVRGASMGEALPDGTPIDVQFSEKPVLRRGTVVYLRRGDQRVAHRLVARFGPLCLERGDATRYPRLCLCSSIIGIVRPAQEGGDAPNPVGSRDSADA